MADYDIDSLTGSYDKQDIMQSFIVGFSPVTWDDVIGLYYYYIGNKSTGDTKTGCTF